MTILKRFTRLFKADVHSIIDSLEEPKAVLQQALREMENILASEERLLNESTQKLKQFESNLDKLETSIARTKKQTDLCFNNQKLDLAKRLIRQKLEYETTVEIIKTKQHDLGQEIAMTRERIQEYKETIQQIEVKQKLCDVSDIANEQTTSSTNKGAITEEQVEVAFLEELAKREAASTGQ